MNFKIRAKVVEWGLLGTLALIDVVLLAATIQVV